MNNKIDCQLNLKLICSDVEKELILSLYQAVPLSVQVKTLLLFCAQNKTTINDLIEKFKEPPVKLPDDYYEYKDFCESNDCDLDDLIEGFNYLEKVRFEEKEKDDDIKRLEQGNKHLTKPTNDFDPKIVYIEDSEFGQYMPGHPDYVPETNDSVDDSDDESRSVNFIEDLSQLGPVKDPKLLAATEKAAQELKAMQEEDKPLNANVLGEQLIKFVEKQKQLEQQNQNISNSEVVEVEKGMANEEISSEIPSEMKPQQTLNEQFNEFVHSDSQENSNQQDSVEPPVEKGSEQANLGSEQKQEQPEKQVQEVEQTQEPIVKTDKLELNADLVEEDTETQNESSDGDLSEDEQKFILEMRKKQKKGFFSFWRKKDS